MLVWVIIIIMGTTTRCVLRARFLDIKGLLEHNMKILGLPSMGFADLNYPTKKSTISIAANFYNSGLFQSVVITVCFSEIIGHD